MHVVCFICNFFHAIISVFISFIYILAFLRLWRKAVFVMFIEIYMTFEAIFNFVCVLFVLVFPYL